MKAVILAAGLGTRLKPITDMLPKVLVPLKGKPLLQYQLEWLKKNGISNIAINLHHLSEKIIKFVEQSDFKDDVTFSHEPEILGTSGGVKKLQSFLQDDDFLVFHGDNITNLNIQRLFKFHKQKNGIAIICLHEVQPEYVHESSVIVLDENQQIISFIEKPQHNEIDLFRYKYSNAGIYALSPRIFDYIPEGFSDFGKDIFPKLLEAKEQIFGFPLIDCFWRELGTPQKYKKLEEEIKDIEL